MIQRGTIGLLGLIMLALPSVAFAGAEKMFESLTHDFGSVPSGPLLTHYYRFTNNTGQPVRIVGCRVSCGCVAATAMKADIAPGESSSIYATMDSRRFAGTKSVTIFVNLDKPQWEEIRLTINAFGRSDMAMDPDGLGFGSVSKGGTGAAKMTLSLRQPQWAVQKVTSGSDFVSPAVKELRRTATEVEYEISAQLRPGLPVGKWVTDVTLTTNSSIAPTITIPAVVEITPTLMVSPGEVTMGPTSAGNPSEQKLLVRGGQPFRIKEIQGTDSSLSATSNLDEARPVHIITVKYDPKDPKDTKELIRKLRIITDLPSEGIAEVSVKAPGIPK